MNDVLQTLADLVRINSINPSYEGGVGEEEVARYVEAFFTRRGIETWRQTVVPGRDNVIARIPGAQQAAASSSKPTWTLSPPRA